MSLRDKCAVTCQSYRSKLSHWEEDNCGYECNTNTNGGTSCYIPLEDCEFDKETLAAQDEVIQACQECYRTLVEVTFAEVLSEGRDAEVVDTALRANELVL